MDYVYRIRPCNSNTIDEIQNHYLWFSRRKGFKDTDDANIGAFIDNNEVLLEALKRFFSCEQINDFGKAMDYTGLCCFTKALPSVSQKGIFPKNKRCVCVQYSRDNLESYFAYKYGIRNCFNDVIYLDSPIIFKEDDEHHIISKIEENGCLYESILSLTRDARGMDKLMNLLLTRINSKYRNQKETRIIWGGYNIHQYDETVLGYKVEIPQDAIVSVSFYKDTPQVFIETIKGLQYPCKYVKSSK